MVEEDLFEYLIGCCYPDLLKAKSPISRWDCYSPNERHRIELKCRSVHYDTLLIEKKKYDAMMEKCIDNLDTPIYINSTPNGIYMFNLFSIREKIENGDISWEIQYHRKTTHFANKNRVAKEIAMLDVKDADIL